MVLALSWERHAFSNRIVANGLEWGRHTLTLASFKDVMATDTVRRSSSQRAGGGCTSANLAWSTDRYAAMTSIRDAFRRRRVVHVAPVDGTSPGRRGLRWFLAEFLVVASGVLVALAVNAWWQDRIDAARERGYLQQLLADSRANLAEVDRFTRLEDEVAASADRFFRAAHLSTRAPADSLRAALVGSIFLPSLSLRTSTWDALVQSNEIRLIRNALLRDRLVDFAGRLAYAGNRLDRLTDAGFDGITLILRRVDVFELADSASRRSRGWHDLESRFAPDWYGLLDDRDFVSIVETTGRAAAGRSAVVGTLREPIRELIERLEMEVVR